MAWHGMAWFGTMDRMGGDRSDRTFILVPFFSFFDLFLFPWLLVLAFWLSLLL